MSNASHPAPTESSASRKGTRNALKRKFVRAFFGEFTEAILAAVLVAVILRVFFVAIYRVPTDSMAPTLIPGDFVVGFKTSYGIKLPFSDSHAEKWGARVPRRGDVVAFRIPGDGSLYVKRVIGIPGDRISIHNGIVHVNEVSVTSAPMDFAAIPRETRDSIEKWPSPDAIEYQLEITPAFDRGASDLSTHLVMRRKDAFEPDFLAALIVPPGQLFLLGDFRSESVDSRQWGTMPISAVESRVAWIAFSLHTLSSPLSDSTGADLATDEQASVRPLARPRWGRIFQSVR